MKIKEVKQNSVNYGEIYVDCFTCGWSGILADCETENGILFICPDCSESTLDSY